MKKYLIFIVRDFLGLDNDYELNQNQILSEPESELENQTKIENNNEIEKIQKHKTNLMTWSNLFYVIGIISLLGISIYLYNNDWFTINSHINKIGHLKNIDDIGNLLYKLSAELSKSSTVRSWEIIHNVLKELEKDSFNSLELITELEKLKKINILFPGQFSTNHDSFEKSLTKLINFLKEIF